ncbi:hypothetical protein TNCV_844291 [Trichonephila clavipes]|nr:hypothetical protein TNCV_4837041 [Trichonephila clavipes]GFU61569.1 hypothetical protein TNCV_844291 [Trichonephila clavipes]
MTVINFLHHENPPTWAGFDPGRRPATNQPLHEILILIECARKFEIQLSGFEAPCYDPSRCLIARPAPRLFTSPIPGGFYVDF